MIKCSYVATFPFIIPTIHQSCGNRLEFLKSIRFCAIVKKYLVCSVGVHNSAERIRNKMTKKLKSLITETHNDQGIDYGTANTKKNVILRLF